jgi:hypothetical protein
MYTVRRGIMYYKRFVLVKQVVRTVTVVTANVSPVQNVRKVWNRRNCHQFPSFYL